MRSLTIANQPTSKVVGVYPTSRFGTAGGGILRLRRFSTASTGGTMNNTPNAKHPSTPAISCTFFNDGSAITPGATAKQMGSVGFAQTGGQGGWVAVEPDDAIKLLANGGANGNLDYVSICNAASVTFDFAVDIQED